MLTGDYFLLNNPISVERNDAMTIRCSFFVYFKCITSVSKYQALTKYIYSLLFLKNKKDNF